MCKGCAENYSGLDWHIRHSVSDQFNLLHPSSPSLAPFSNPSFSFSSFSSFCSSFSSFSNSPPLVPSLPSPCLGIIRLELSRLLMKRNNENGEDDIAWIFCDDVPLFLYLVLSKNDCHSLVFLQYFEQMSFSWQYQ